MALIEARGFTREDFAKLHPAGQLGKQLLRVDQLMHAGDALPRVAVDTPMRDAIYEMSKKGLGITAVVDEEGRLAGCISDGDLRRLLETEDGTILGRTAGERMTRGPRTIAGAELAAAALKAMEDRRITPSSSATRRGGSKGWSTSTTSGDWSCFEDRRRGSGPPGAEPLALFDIDGCLTDGSLVYGPAGEEWKVFSVRDGVGLKLAKEAG